MRGQNRDGGVDIISLNIDWWIDVSLSIFIYIQLYKSPSPQKK